MHFRCVLLISAAAVNSRCAHVDPVMRREGGLRNNNNLKKAILKHQKENKVKTDQIKSKSVPLLTVF